MNYPIETGIPPPSRERSAGVNYRALPLATMAVGASFFVKESDCGERSIHGVAAYIRTKAKRLGVSIRTEVQRPKSGVHGLRVWRV